MYTIKELVKAARQVFKVSPVLVEVALKSTGKLHFTLDEAKDIVSKFAKKPITI